MARRSHINNDNDVIVAVENLNQCDSTYMNFSSITTDILIRRKEHS